MPTTRPTLTSADERAQRRVALVRAIAYLVSHPAEDALDMPLTWHEELSASKGVHYRHLSITVQEETLRRVVRDLEERHGVPPTRVVGEALPLDHTVRLLRALLTYYVAEDDLELVEDPSPERRGIPASVEDVHAYRRTVTLSARHWRLADLEYQQG